MKLVKKLLKILAFGLLGGLACFSYVQATSCLIGQQGGTGICSATAGQTGYVPAVSTTNPLTYTLVPQDGGGTTTVAYPDNVPLVLGTATPTQFIYDAATAVHALELGFATSTNRINGLLCLPQNLIGIGIPDALSGGLGLNPAQTVFVCFSPDFTINTSTGQTTGNGAGFVIGSTTTQIFSIQALHLPSNFVDGIITFDQQESGQATTSWIGTVQQGFPNFVTTTVINAPSGGQDIFEINNFPKFTVTSDTVFVGFGVGTLLNSTTISQNLTVLGTTSTFNNILGNWVGQVIGTKYGGTGQDSSNWTGLLRVVNGNWATTTVSFNELTNTSSVALLNANQTFTGLNTFNNTTTMGNASITNLIVTSCSGCGDGTGQWTTTTLADGIYYLNKVGIGTATPGDKLTVDGGNESILNGYLNIGSNTINASPNFGVGSGNTISGAGSVVGGENNTVFALNNGMFGDTNISRGSGNLMSGESNIATSTSFIDTIGGFGNYESGAESIMNGQTNSSTATNAFTIGQNNGNNGQLSGVGGESVSVDSGSMASVAWGDSIALKNSSFAIGIGNSISMTNALYGAAFGVSEVVTGTAGFTAGENNTVTGLAGIALGDNNFSEGHSSYALGGDINQAAGDYCGALGDQSFCNGLASFAAGNNDSANGEGSVAIGEESTAVGAGATAIGTENNANRQFSGAFGENLTVNATSSFGINVSSTTKTITQQNVIDLLGGNVGINTTSPSAQLAIVGNIWQEGPYVHFGNGQCGYPNSLVGGTGEEFCGTDNTNAGVNDILSNSTAGTSSFADLFLQNDLSDDGLVDNYAVLNLNSSKYSNSAFGTLVNVPNQLLLQNTLGSILIDTASSTTGTIQFGIGGVATSSLQATLSKSGLLVNTAVTSTRLVATGDIVDTANPVAGGVWYTNDATGKVAMGQNLFNWNGSSLAIQNTNHRGELTVGAAGTATIPVYINGVVNQTTKLLEIHPTDSPSGIPVFSVSPTGTTAMQTSTVSQTLLVTGNVGIGTTTLSQALTVAGNFSLSQALMPNNLAGSSGQVLESQGTNTAPIWVSTSTLGFPVILAATSASLGGGLLTAGTCASNTTTVSGATTAMVALTDPVTYPGDGSIYDAYVSAANVVTVKVCAIVTVTPSASTYNIRVIK